MLDWAACKYNVDMTVKNHVPVLVSHPFMLQAPYKPAGDQEAAIAALSAGLQAGVHDQTLLGITGSGKTFTMANIINDLQRPALIMAHNKTLAAQLYGEMKQYFPNNAVEYFVSYYDYYQPEAYIPRTDTFIEKDSAINEQIDQLRHSATRSLLERRDVIVVASVSCIYGLGSPELYAEMVLHLEKGLKIDRQSLLKRLVMLHYTRNDIECKRGSFRTRGDRVDIFPAHSDAIGWRLAFFGEELEQITEFDPLTGEKLNELPAVTIFASSHYVTPQERMKEAVKEIKLELKARSAFFESQQKWLEMQRIDQRTGFDIEMLNETGSCKGIENYSRYLSGRGAGAPPPTLFEYLPKDAILFVDESHVTVPQVGGMYNGDRSRKTTLVEYGFRLPSALDNRPLQFAEWERMRPQTIFVSATPSVYELNLSVGHVAKQIIRPTGLLDPLCIVRPVATQVDDLLSEIRLAVAAGERVLVTTLTKKMAEDLSSYLKDLGVGVSYLHSDIQTLERAEIIQSLRRGDIDVLIGVNLLREGLDIPECALVAILDADKEGFLRSETALVQTIGRAARHQNGRVLLYADVMTRSLKAAITVTEERRAMQENYNKEHGITPRGITHTQNEDSPLLMAAEGLLEEKPGKGKTSKGLPAEQDLAMLRKEMRKAAEELNFERAAELRDLVHSIEAKLLGLTSE